MSNSEETTVNPSATEESQAAVPVGSFCWWELGTNDPAGAKDFYTNLMDWSSFDNPMGNSVYTTFTVGDKGAAAMYQMGEDLTSQGVPPHWLSYVLVTNVDESAAKVTENGGAVMAGPFDVMDFGRMAVARDPQGAAFAMWQPGTHKGASLVSEVGGNCWNELHTTDGAGAKAFYAAVFGWMAEDQQMGPMTYTMMKNSEGANVGGMMQMSAEWGNVPSNWMPYTWVADCDATAAKAEELGGKLIEKPMDVPGVGRMAIVQDPQGAVSAIIRMNDMPSE